MTAWTTISNALVAVGAKPFATTMQSLRDNISAALEGATSAPYDHYAWHPYNGVAVGDGITGLIYDFAVTGLVASVDSPSFLPGYDYRMRGRGVSAAAANTFRILVFRVVGAAWSPNVAAADFLTAAAASAYDFDLALTTPHVSGFSHDINTKVTLSPGVNDTVAFSDGGRRVTHGVKETISAMRLQMSTSSIDAGQIFMDKRRSII